MKRFYKVALVLLVPAALWLHSFQNGGFRTSKLISHIPPVLEQPPPEVDFLLDQPFHYFGKGGTSFVFLGEDGKTILKLFKHQHLFPKSHKKKRPHKHHSFFFSSCRIAYNDLKEETALIYLCKEPNPHFTKPIPLIDSWGFTHCIDLAQTEFAIQKKADLFFPCLAEFLKKGQTEKIKESIDALLEFIRCRCRKGIGDRDPNLWINFGLIDGKVVAFDLGSWVPKPELKNPLMEARELFFATYALQKWLKDHCPELLDYLLDCIHKKPLPGLCE